MFLHRPFPLRNIALLCTILIISLPFIRRGWESWSPRSIVATLWTPSTPPLPEGNTNATGEGNPQLQAQLPEAQPEHAAALANFDVAMPEVQYPDHKYTWIDTNQRGTHALFRCIERGDCAQNQTKVVILTSDYFRVAKEKNGRVTGEVVWALSTIRALENMGYTTLYASSMHIAAGLYHLFDSAVKIVIADPAQAQGCFESSTCVRSKTNPAGIPAWRTFSFHFWAHASNPLGSKWTLSPEDYGTNTYLGYSIEAQCARFPFIPHAERKSGQVYILAKYLKFFRAPETAWPPEFYDAAVNETGASFIAAATDREDAVISSD